ncbi:hypothetical protein OS493_002283 [Desmophyllum pertusum]|uniref:Helicase ATP-binding domain-containing protein n=1 Tax=Desmophyllum pertusum TaxID=174260 RepID=A0A9X0CV78_9CNID|nr:hypothetical protein OS493_002283 [Desmophyllum pertusum]
MDFPEPLPTFNLYSYAVEYFSQEKLLPPQSEALRKLQGFFDTWEAGRISIGLISMPTGSGKTGIISCLPYFLGKRGLNPPPAPRAPPYGEPLHRFDKPVLIIAPDLAIASQLERRLTVSADGPGENFLLRRKIIQDENRRALPQGVKIEDTKHVQNPEFLRNKDIVIANAQKFLKNNWEDALPDDIFKLVIVDEAHHHPATTWRRIVQKFKNHAMVAFFTATPFRGDGKPVLDDKEGKLVYHLRLKEARETRIIRTINWVQLGTGATDLWSICRLILEKVKSIQETKDEEHPLPGNIPHMAIAIAKDIDHAKEVASIWNDIWGSPGSAVTHHSKLPKKTKKKNMEKILSNQVKLVVVVAMLLEGFDHPPISIAAIMTRIGSPVKFSQFVGRAQRLVRDQEESESQHILADIVTGSLFNQRKNYKAYEKEEWIEDM